MVLTHVLQIVIVLTFFSFLALLSFWGSVGFFFFFFFFFCHLTEKIFWPSQVSRTYETVSEFLLIASYLFFSNAMSGKKGSGSNWYLLLVIRFYANGDPPLETMRMASLASSDSHHFNLFFKRQRSNFHLRFTCFYSCGPINCSLWNKTVLD